MYQLYLKRKVVKTPETAEKFATKGAVLKFQQSFAFVAWC